MMFLLCYQNIFLVSLTYVNKNFSIPVVIKTAFRQAHQNHSRGKNGMQKTSPDGRAKTSRPQAFAERPCEKFARKLVTLAGLWYHKKQEPFLSPPIG